MKITYHKEGDYLYPDLLPAEKEEMGKTFGQIWTDSIEIPQGTQADYLYQPVDIGRTLATSS